MNNYQSWWNSSENSWSIANVQPRQKEFENSNQSRQSTQPISFKVSRYSIWLDSDVPNLLRRRTVCLKADLLWIKDRFRPTKHPAIKQTGCSHSNTSDYPWCDGPIVIANPKEKIKQKSATSNLSQQLSDAASLILPSESATGFLPGQHQEKEFQSKHAWANEHCISGRHKCAEQVFCLSQLLRTTENSI